jgi:dolichol kinase
MNSDILNTLILGSFFLALFAFTEVLYHKKYLQVEYTRKIAHFGTGFLTFLFPIYLDSHWWVLLLCSSFAILLLTSLKFGFLKSINAVDRVTYGSLYYPLSVYICFLVYYYSGKSLPTFYLPIAMLAICDPLAALFGKRWPIGPYSIGGNKKSLMGSSAFFISAVLLCASFLPAETFTWFHFMGIALVATLFEAASNKGIDNLFIPTSVSALLYIMIH